MIWQLRTYRLRSGAMDEFREVWRDYVVPSRSTHGFTVAGGWYDDDDDSFIWLVGHQDRRSFLEAEQKYYADPDRTSWPDLGPDVIAAIDTRMLKEA